LSKLSSIELLEVNKEAVGGQEFSERHKALLEKSQELKRLEITVRQNEETLTKFKALNAKQGERCGACSAQRKTTAKGQIDKKETTLAKV